MDDLESRLLVMPTLHHVALVEIEMPLDLKLALVMCSNGRLKGLFIKVELQAKVALYVIGNRLTLLVK